ncbi:Conserved_hypothetical protein [Hexamita inflata]|uniref:Uncharacterized protein n=1 Tax=Hexamita inflata TaxID=28002 RepID=A0AA86UK89_9EUKA|nr:Conserved hypothetical protein [Hexamita inflata]
MFLFVVQREMSSFNKRKFDGVIVAASCLNEVTVAQSQAMSEIKPFGPEAGSGGITIAFQLFADTSYSKAAVTAGEILQFKGVTASSQKADAALKSQLNITFDQQFVESKLVVPIVFITPVTPNFPKKFIVNQISVSSNNYVNNAGVEIQNTIQISGADIFNWATAEVGLYALVAKANSVQDVPVENAEQTIESGTSGSNINVYVNKELEPISFYVGLKQVIVLSAPRIIYNIASITWCGIVIFCQLYLLIQIRFINYKIYLQLQFKVQHNLNLYENKKKYDQEVNQKQTLIKQLEERIVVTRKDLDVDNKQLQVLRQKEIFAHDGPQSVDYLSLKVTQTTLEKAVKEMERKIAIKEREINNMKNK